MPSFVKLRTDLRNLNLRRSLRARIALIVAALTLMLSIVLTTITGGISGQALRRSSGQNLARLSATTMAQLDQVLFERWREIRITASQSALFTVNNTSGVQALLNQLQSTYRYYSWIGWADPSGQVVVSTDDRLEGQSVTDLAWFQQSHELTTPYIGNVQPLPGMFDALPAIDHQHDRFVSVAMAIRDPAGNSLGVLGAYLNWQFVVEQSRNVEQQFADQTAIDVPAPPVPFFISPAPPLAQVFILDRDGTILNGASAFQPSGTGTVPDKLDLAALLKKPLTQTPNYSMATWPDDGDVYLTGYAMDPGYRDFPGLGWVVVIREQADLELVSIRQLQLLLLAIGVVFALIFSGLGWFLAGRLTRPLVHVAQLAREIKTGDPHDTQPGLIGTADEVAVLSQTIDRLLVSLNTRNTQLIELNGTLEQQVEQRTAELVRSQSLNTKMVATIFDLIYVFDVEQGLYTFLSPAITHLFGYSGASLQGAAAGQTWPTIHPDDRPAYDASRLRLLTLPDGDLIELMYRVRHQDGRWVWIHSRETVFARGSGGHVSQIFGVAQDVTLRKQAESEVRQLAAAEERQRLARELHDSVTQTIFSASVVAQTLPLLWDQGEAIVKNNLNELGRLTRGALAEMRTLLNELRPAAISTVDLGELLQQLADATRGRTQATCELTIEGSGSLPSDVQVAAYRIAQESLNNVTKHARASRIAIHLTRSPTVLTMTINDDGRGFNTEITAAAHFGLAIMAERAREIGASLTVHSQPGAGTQVRFEWHADLPGEAVDHPAALALLEGTHA